MGHTRGGSSSSNALTLLFEEKVPPVSCEISIFPAYEIIREQRVPGYHKAEHIYIFICWDNNNRDT